MSPSQANEYDRCPLQYAMGRFVTVQDADSPYLTFGTLVHQVLEDAEAAAMEDGRERATFGEAMERLDSRWDELGFGNDSVGRAWYRRAEATLDHLYSRWPTSACSTPSSDLDPVAQQILLKSSAVL